MKLCFNFLKATLLTPRSAFCLTTRYYSQKNRDAIQKYEQGLADAKKLETENERIARQLKEDFTRVFKGQLTVPGPKVPRHVDYLIIGGGIMGSSIAYWLKQRAPDSFNIMVAERDPTYSRCSSTLSVGGIRQQFSLQENIMLSLFSSEFLRNIKQYLCVLDDDPPDIQFQPHGYLFLASEAGAAQMIENHNIQMNCGAKVELLDQQFLKRKFPWLNVKGVALGSYGFENEGWFDPWCLLSAFKKKAKSFGTHFIQGEIIGFEFEETKGFGEPPFVTHFAYLQDEVGDVHKIEFSTAVVAAGPHSAEVARMLRIGKGKGILSQPLPIEPRKRYVYTFHCDKGPGIDMPLVIDPTGAYVRREGLGGMYICGRSPTEEDEPDVSNLEVDYNFFDESVWPVIAERIPCFEAIKASSAWAGYYDYNTFDQNALFGYHPFYDNIFFVTGFSGHGIQMAPGIGRAACEILLEKDFHTLDLSRFGLNRLFHGIPLLEKNIV